jgi:hypothetical protein
MPYPEEDCISSRLEVGSLVVPKKVVDSGVLKEYNGKLHGKGTDDPKKLSPTIVMPGEWVVAKEHAPKVESFLRRKGIRLPLGG